MNAKGNPADRPATEPRTEAAATTLLVHVTQDHIDRGNSRPNSCPIALAVKEATGAHYVEVGADDDLIDIDYHLYRLTTKGLNFIKRFDNGQRVRPAIFRFFALPAFD